jgi:hypothetical protein
MEVMNPYYDMTAVRNPDMFFGRTNLLRSLYSAITHHQCISLVGSRHIGKSSVLRCMHRPEIYTRFGYDLSRYVLVFIDLREYLQKTCADFFNSVSKKIVSKCRDQLELELLPGGGQDQFSDLLDQIQEQGFHLALLMDAFDNVTRNSLFDMAFFAFLRAQASMEKVSYITASIAPLHTVCHRDIQGSPFFNIFSTYTLESLTYEEARDLVMVPARRAGLPFKESEADWVLKLAGRHPFFIQRVCHFLFEEKLLKKNVADRSSVRSRAYEDLLPHFEDAWERLSEEEREILKGEARHTGSSEREQPELSESMLFRRFVRNRYNLQLFNMTPDEVEKVLDKINDMKVLGESDLRHLRIVSGRLKQEGANENALLAHERGIAVREVLDEAFERLRGNGIRRDTAPDWKLYNILYYRYFKNHLKNEQIVARLELSTRQYFRERNKAIEALFNTLLAMETAETKNDED